MTYSIEQSIAFATNWKQNIASGNHRPTPKERGGYGKPGDRFYVEPQIYYSKELDTVWHN